MPSVTFKCPNCGGPLKFDPGEQMFTCEYCLSKFSEQTLTELAKKEEAKAEAQKDEYKAKEAEAKKNEAGEGGFHTVVYSCPSCGAEIVTDDTTAATYCYFCHNPVVLSTRLTDEFKPDLVLPFKIEKEDAKKKFLDWTRGKRFVPRGFFTQQNIDNLSGVYYPYWATDFKTDASFNGEGEIITTYSTSTEDVTETAHYAVMRSGNIEFNNLMRSALKKEDHQLGNGIHPYDLTDVKPFSMAYLSGFLAEKRDITKDEIRPEILTEIDDYIEPLLTADAHYTSLHGSVSKLIKGESFRYIMLPTWVLTYRDNAGKLWHYAMNGQTGTLCGKLPIDKGRLMGLCGIIAGAAALIGILGGLFIW